MPGAKIAFGTDGWRGRIAEDFTYDAVRRCSAGFAEHLRRTAGDSLPVVIGYDKRFASEHFAAAAAEVLAAQGFRVLLTDGPTPTPVISYAVVSQQAAGAINITASHNPPDDNGFKVRDHRGGAIPPQGLQQIESAIPSSDDDVARMPLQQALAAGRVQRFDPAPAYLEHIAELVDLDPLRRASLTVLIDCMWGNGAGWFPRLLGGQTIRLIEMHNIRNPVFPEMIRPEPIPPNVDPALHAVRPNGADVLLITDGDADRLGLGDENGVFIDQLRAFGLLAYYMLEIRGERGPIVKTLSTTSMLDKLGREYGVPVYETGVGFKYVAPKMVEVDAMIGGEESGGYAFRNHVPERDGILAGLYVLDMMVRTGKKPSALVEDLFRRVGAHYYDRIDTPLPPEQRQALEDRVRHASPKAIAGLPVTGLNSLDGYKYLLGERGWMLIRFSGTEPIVRVYCETTEVDRVQPILQDGLRLLGLK
ncbi:MAG: phosphoglucomutase/phosphomannomutase family protein [Anaerolineales bacterium]|nr:phosphoglucomutase/phosphomannomutase family protein [Anaerolineales bacterium]